jgi:hypothetical protein
MLAEPEECAPGEACAQATLDGEADGHAAHGGAANVGSAANVRSGAPVRPPAAPPESRIGAPCEPPSADDGVGADSVAVGELSLSEGGSCGANNLCLTRARPDESACSSAALGPDRVCPDQQVVPIPPSLAPALPPVEGLCTCHCGGFEQGAEYCTCPAGMSCRELIRTLGTNGAARDYAGSYCVY